MIKDINKEDVKTPRPDNEQELLELYTELGAIEYNILIHTASLDKLTSLKQDIVNRLQVLTQPPESK